MSKQNQLTVQELIDLLGEGELTSSEREQLFARLDRDPPSWKHCALSLLEQRALRATLGHSSKIASEVQSRRERSGRQFHRGALAKYVSLATSASVLFLVGWFLGQHSPAKIDARSLTVPAPTTHAIARKLEARDRDLLAKFKEATKAVGEADCQLIAFVGYQVDQEEAIYPIIESENLARQLRRIPAPRLPDTVRASLKEKGFRVKTRKQILSYKQADGARKTIPIGSLDYEYVGRQTF